MTYADAQRQARIRDEVRAERARQHDLHGDQSHLPMGLPEDEHHRRLRLARLRYDIADSEGQLTYRLILDEEFCEVLAAETIEEMRTELIQVAALCLQTVETIDKGAET